MTSPFKKSGWGQGIYEISSTQKEALGSLRITQDGRKFRYALAGGSALAAGKVGVAPAAAANHVNIAVATAAAIGDRLVNVTLGATAAAEDLYKDGYFMVNDATGEGTNIKIAGHAAIGSAGTGDIYLEDPLPIALVAGTSQVSLIKSPWSGVTESTTEENLAVGVPQLAVTAAYYYWAQTGGVANVLASGTGAVGSIVTLAGAAAGAAIVISTTIATTVTQPIIGHLFATAQVDTEYKPVFLCID